MRMIGCSGSEPPVNAVVNTSTGRSGFRHPLENFVYLVKLQLVFLWLGSSWSCDAQVYPKWFLEQGNLACRSAAVGYANNSYYVKSSATHAFRDACNSFSRQEITRISGGQAFWETEAGTFAMGSDIKEQFDTAEIAHAANFLIPLDTSIADGMVVVLVGSPRCRLDEFFRERVNITSASAPSWIESLPKDSLFYYAVGLSSEYYYESSSWKEAEQAARRNLARSICTEIKALHKRAGQENQEIRDDNSSVALKDFQVVSRWRDVKRKIFSVLIRMNREK